MEQLIGSNCVACQKRISSILEAENCKVCGNPIHNACKRQMEAGDGLEICHACGYAPRERTRSVMLAMEQQTTQGNLAFVVVGTIVSIIGILLLIGNVTGVFPTFPFAGFIVLLIGGGIAGAGRRM